jgi:hypothetical protein
MKSINLIYFKEVKFNKDLKNLETTLIILKRKINLIESE